MARAATAVWEARSTGNAANGAAFNPANASAGTDYSQQDAAQVVYSDLVIGNPTTTQLTSAGNPFTTLYPGNHIKIVGGGGFTAGYYEVVSVAGAVATMDRSVGVAGSTGGAGNLGGAADHPNTIRIGGIVVSGNTIWMRGSFNVAATMNGSNGGADNAPISWLGYSSVRGDNGQAALLCTNGAATSIMATIADETWRNVIFDGANLAQFGANTLSGNRCLFENCTFTRCTNYGLNNTGTGTKVRRCLATSCGGSGAALGGFFTSDNSGSFIACAAKSNANGFIASGAAGHFIHCLASGNNQSGFYQTGSQGIRLLNCTSVGNTLDGLRMAASCTYESTLLVNNLFANNSGYGQNSVTTNYNHARLADFQVANAYYNNTLGSYNQVIAGATDQTITLDPFSNYAGGDYSLNNATSAGALLRFAGQPGGFGLETSPETTTSSIDIGASQAGPTTGAGGVGDAPTLRSLWRELTNERSTTVVPDGTVDIYINGGLQALNRRIRYHLTDTTTAITLVTAQQEYALPSDCVFVAWIQYNGKEIQKSDTDEWRRRDIDWRNAKPGNPIEWAHYRDKVILYPPPDSAAVATNSGLLVRYVSSPPDFTAAGAEQLNLEDRRIPVYWAVAEWAAAHPDSALATIRSEEFTKRFEQEAQIVAKDYTDRMVSR